MSSYQGKKILLVGDKVALFEEIEKHFSADGALLSNSMFSDVTLSHLEQSRYDLVVIDSVSNEKSSTELLNIIRTSKLYKKLPVLCLVRDDDSHIQSVLTLGAADYFTQNEPVSATDLKVKNLLGESNNFAGGQIINIPEDKAKTSKKGIKVYMVEDDPLLRNLLGSKLTESEFPFEYSVSGEGALAEIKLFAPHVIILDLMLPVKNGLEILRELKADSQLASIPVIIFSNRDETTDRDAAKALGANKFFIKAMTNLSELVEAIEELAP